MDYITPRGDNFYYIEVWDIVKFRDEKINTILDIDDAVILPKYLSGSLKRLDIENNIECASFWKDITSAKNRFTSLKGNNQLDGIKLVLKIASREEFINIISKSGIQFSNCYNSLKRNIKLMKEEQIYLEKLKSQEK